MIDLLFDHTLRTVALGSAVLGLISGMLGTFAMLRRQSLLGDAIAHAALPGIYLAFLLTEAQSPLILGLGAAIAGWFGTLLVMAVVNTTRIKTDSALGILLSVFFGAGLVLLTYIQHRHAVNASGLEQFLFGQAAAMLESDVRMMALLGGAALALMLGFWKEFKILAFDPVFGASLGLPMRGIETLLTTLIVVAIVIGLQTVGVVLMSAMLVAPAAAARQWTDRLGIMVVISGAFGIAAGVSGAMLSALTERLPTGPTIVLCASALVLISLIAAPHRGLMWQWGRGFSRRRKLALEVALTALSESPQPRPMPTASTLRALASRGLIERQTGGDGEQWHLTTQGRARAEQILAHLSDTALDAARQAGSGRYFIVAPPHAPTSGK